MNAKKIISFGFRHRIPFQGSVRVLDVRELLRNPYHNKALRKLNGLHPDVQADILLTPRFPEIYAMLKAIVKRAVEETVAIGCTGGHHRSVYIVDRIGRELGLPVEHRDLDKP